MNQFIENVSKRMYDVYKKNVEGYSFNGEKMPETELFFKDEQYQVQANAWRKVTYDIMFTDEDEFK